jgi:hypothetical protein
MVTSDSVLATLVCDGVASYICVPGGEITEVGCMTYCNCDENLNDQVEGTDNPICTSGELLMFCTNKFASNPDCQCSV